MTIVVQLFQFTKNCQFSGLFPKNQRTTNSLFFEQKNIRIKELWLPVISKPLIWDQKKWLGICEARTYPAAPRRTKLLCLINTQVALLFSMLLLQHHHKCPKLCAGFGTNTDLFLIWVSPNSYSNAGLVHRVCPDTYNMGTCITSINESLPSRSDLSKY
jgi:hypothetical protein